MQPINIKPTNCNLTNGVNRLVGSCMMGKSPLNGLVSYLEQNHTIFLMFNFIAIFFPLRYSSTQKNIHYYNQSILYYWTINLIHKFNLF